jgi:hypothetical protein
MLKDEIEKKNQFKELVKKKTQQRMINELFIAQLELNVM